MMVLKCPVACSCSRCDCDTTLFFLLHPVHRRCTIMSLTKLVVYTSIIKDTLCQCGLTSIDMRHNTNISGSIQWIFSSSQVFFLLILLYTSSNLLLESVVCESLVCFCHLVHVFFSLNRCTSIVCCI